MCSAFDSRGVRMFMAVRIVLAAASSCGRKNSFFSYLSPTVVMAGISVLFTMSPAAMFSLRASSSSLAMAESSPEMTAAVILSSGLAVPEALAAGVEGDEAAVVLAYVST